MSPLYCKQRIFETRKACIAWHRNIRNCSRKVSKYRCFKTAQKPWRVMS